MTNTEFYQEFQILYNNIMNNQAPGLDEYEVSVFLTRAQEEFIKGYYNGTLGNSFEETEEIRRYLDALVKTVTMSPKQNPTTIKLTNKSYLFDLPKDCWFITFEKADYENENCDGVITSVIPVTQDDFHRIYRNPFKGITDRRILRLDSSKGETELVSKYPIATYTIRYISRPKPIILTDLDAGEYAGSGLTIDLESKETPCDLHPALHRKILEGAVSLAIASLKTPTNNK